MCTAGGTCACDRPWAGAACETLTFAATTPASGKSLYDAGASKQNTWNGAFFEGADGRYRAYVPLYAAGSLGSPVSLLHGVADALTGPYTWTTQAEVPGAENPAAVVYADASGRRVYTLWLGGRVWTSAAADGPFAAVPNFSYPGGNAAPIYHGGAFYMTNQATTQLFRCAALAPGAQWAVVANISHAALPANQYHVEDPVLWVDARGRWHILNHADSNLEFSSCNSSAISAHFYSADGLADWRWAAQPYGHIVRYDDGSVHAYSTLERPKLSFAADGAPAFLHLAADLVTGDEGCANRTKHAHNGHTPCDNCKWDDLAGTIVVALA